jgi:hypothetical protein
MNKNQVNDKNDNNIIVKKRGRKSKKELELNQAKLAGVSEIINQSKIEDKSQEDTISSNDKMNALNNIHVIIEDSDKDDNVNDVENLLENDNVNDVENNEILDNNFLSQEQKLAPKKRGRKPKGGKIIKQVISNDSNKEVKPNVILHLKCSLKDLYNNSSIENDIQSYNFSNTNLLSYDIINQNKSFNTIEKYITLNEISNSNDNNTENDIYYENDTKQNKENDIRDIWKKLKLLEHNLHTNNICDKKSACFWCTCDFDNPPVYIPKYNINESYHVYGCFCSPECGTAYLMEEHIDSSSKFERYHLMNHIYTKIYDYKKNIKPAPNPYYMLDKYYGNLSIQEYRSLLRNERLFLVVDKPLTRILPELHEDNDDFIINNKIIPSNTYQIKKKLQKKTKNNILSERFGLDQRV